MTQNTGTPLQNEIRLALGKLRHVRLFRNNVGEAWLGRVAARSADLVTLARPVRVVYGLCVGSSDLIGFTTITITPEMVGQKIAVFTAAEIKSGAGRLSDDQANFLRIVTEAGGRAAEIRSVEDAVRLVQP